MMRSAIMLLLAAASAMSAAHAEDRLKLDQATIFGNRELPKVTFVTPWRDVDIGTPDWKFARTVDQPLTPLDRETQHLQIEIDKQLDTRAHDGFGALLLCCGFVAFLVALVVA